MKTKLIDFNCDKELIDLNDEIFVANESAICILNDLLHYESIDAGKFSLEFTWKPLRLFFGKKIILIVQKKYVQININDEIHVMVYICILYVVIVLFLVVSEGVIVLTLINCHCG
jgi:hypothetical protein